MTDSTGAGLTKEAKERASELRSLRLGVPKMYLPFFEKTSDLIEALAGERTALRETRSSLRRDLDRATSQAERAEAALASQAARVEADARRIAELEEGLKALEKAVHSYDRARIEYRRAQNSGEQPRLNRSGTSYSIASFRVIAVGHRARALLNPDANEATK